MKLFKARGTSVSRRSARLWGLRFKRFGIIAAAAGLVLGSGYYCWKHSPFAQVAAWTKAEMLDVTYACGFKVDDVLVTGRVHIAPDELLSRLGIRQGEPIFAISVDAAQKSVAEISWVKQVTVTRRLPAAVLVDLTERVPAALWQYQQKLSVIDRDGRLLTDRDLGPYQGLPLVVGEDAPAHTAGLLDLLQAEPSLSPAIAAAVRVGGRRWDLRLKNGILVRLPENDVELALSKLARAERQDHLLNKDVTVIDLRLPDETVVAPSSAARLTTGRTTGAEEKSRKTI